MNIMELNPAIEGSYSDRLVIDCPKCRSHRICISNLWKFSGITMDKLTMIPSYNSLVTSCKAHFTITDGEVVLR